MNNKKNIVELMDEAELSPAWGPLRYGECDGDWHIYQEHIDGELAAADCENEAIAHFFAAAPTAIDGLVKRVLAAEAKLAVVPQYAHYFYTEALRLRIDGNMVDAPMSLDEWMAGVDMAEDTTTEDYL